MTPQRFRRRPVTVEAVQWTGENSYEDCKAFCDGGCRRYSGMTLYVTAAGGAYAHFRDWIVRCNGVLSVLSARQFEATYEPVEDGPDASPTWRDALDQLGAMIAAGPGPWTYDPESRTLTVVGLGDEIHARLCEVGRPETEA